MAQYNLSSNTIIGSFFEKYNAASSGSWASSLGWYNNKSQNEVEVYKMLSATGGLHPWVGARQLGTATVFSLNVTNVVYEDTFAVTVEDLRRDYTNQIMARVNEKASRAATHWEVLDSALLEANPTGYDGVSYFSASHNTGSSGTLKNTLTSSEYASLNVVAPTAPTAAELAAVISDSMAHLFSFKDEAGFPCNMDMNEMVFMFPTSWGGAPYTAIGAQFLSSGVTNPLSAIGQIAGLRIIPKANPRLTGSETCYLFRSDGVLKPFIHQEEVPLRIDALAEGSEQEFLNRQHLYGITAVRAAAPGQWKHSVRIVLS